jgi:hypothetical protein
LNQLNSVGRHPPPFLQSANLRHFRNV